MWFSGVTGLGPQPRLGNTLARSLRMDRNRGLNPPCRQVELHFTQSVHFPLEVKSAFIYWVLTISEAPFSKAIDTTVKKRKVLTPAISLGHSLS